MGKWLKKPLFFSHFSNPPQNLLKKKSFYTRITDYITDKLLLFR